MLEPQEILAFKKGGTLVPTFRVFQSTKKAEIINRKVQVEALCIRTASKQKIWVYHLVCQSAEQNLLPYDYKFVPHRLNRKQNTYLGMVVKHMNHMASLRIMPTVGISRQLLKHQTRN